MCGDVCVCGTACGGAWDFACVCACGHVVVCWSESVMSKGVRGCVKFNDCIMVY